RVLAVAVAAGVLLMWVVGLRARLPNQVRTALHLLLLVAALQVALGISTLILVVPIALAAAHQAGAVLLLTAALYFRHTLRATARHGTRCHIACIRRGRRRWPITGPFRQNPSMTGHSSPGRT